MPGMQTLAEARKALEEESKPVVPEQGKAVETPPVDKPKPSDEADGGTAEPKEPWLDDEAGSTSEAGSDKTVPLASHIQLRSKLKARVTEVSDENKQLKDRLAELEQKLLKPRIADIPPAPAKEPDPLDYANPADYRAAKQRYDDERFEARFRLMSQTEEARRRQATEKQQHEQAVDDHYTRVAKLCEEHKLDAEMYHNSELELRRSISLAFPEAADKITDQLIASLGAGSEKVVWWLGRNENGRNELVRRLLSDKTGLQASIYLGEIKAQKAGKTLANSTTRAPAPPPRVNGDGGGIKLDKLEQKYQEAIKKNDVAAQYQIRKQAKEAGLNISNW